MYSSSRRYRKNDWWDLMTVIDQELERDCGPETYYHILDELKWRMVDSISEGATFKINNKVKEVVARMAEDRREWDGSHGIIPELESLVKFFG